MPTIQTIARPRRNRISVAIPDEYSAYSFQVILVPFKEEESKKYDMSDLAGKLRWKGDMGCWRRLTRWYRLQADYQRLCLDIALRGDFVKR